MRFISIVAALVAAVAAQNPFSYPVNGQTINAGDTVNLRWAPSTPGTVTLVVRNGNPSDLNPGTTIACEYLRLDYPSSAPFESLLLTHD